MKNNSIENSNYDLILLLLVLWVYIVINVFIDNIDNRVEHCKCNYIEWHKQYLKYYTYYAICISLYNYHYHIKYLSFYMHIITTVFTIIATYSLYKIVFKLSEVQCKCLIKKQEILYRFMYLLVYVLFIISIIMSVIIFLK